MNRLLTTYLLSKPPIFIFTALPCESKPLIEAFKLKKDISIQLFSIFRNSNIVLTVTGIGKTAMAAGIAYTLALFAQAPNPVLINIGISGHKHHPVGSLFLLSKITDNDTHRRFYPPMVFTPLCPVHSLQTTSTPQSSYPDSDLCDMEASAFYETAIRFSTAELIQCIKIVSDNESESVDQVTPNLVSTLIRSHLGTIESIVSELTKLAASLPTEESTTFELLSSQYRFTANEQIQLKKLLSRWQLLKGKQTFDAATHLPKTGKDFLLLLNQELGKAYFKL